MSTSRDQREAKELIIDPNMESYQELFDFDWAKRIRRQVRGKDIEDAATSMLISWRGIGNTFRMPALIVRQLRGFARGYIKENRPKTPIVLRAVQNGLRGRLQGKLSQVQETLVLQIVKDLADQATLVAPEVEQVFNLERAWSDYIRQPEMRISLWGSQQVCYGAIYFAYEAFLLEALRQKSGDPSLKLWANAAEQRITDHLGAAVFSSAWQDPQIETARLVRHAITHNGAKETDLLRAHGHDIEMTSDRTLHIRPDDNKALMQRLQIAAETIAAHWK